MGDLKVIGLVHMYTKLGLILHRQDLRYKLTFQGSALLQSEFAHSLPTNPASQFVEKLTPFIGLVTLLLINVAIQGMLLLWTPGLLPFVIIGF